MDATVRVLIKGYLKCPICGHIDDAVMRGGILDGVFCCKFMEPVGRYVKMSMTEWREKHEQLRGMSLDDYKKYYKVY